MKKCPPGEYYCNQDKKCKSIPSGYHTARGGFLVRDDYKKKNGMETEMDIPTEMVMEMATDLMVMATVETVVELVKPSVLHLRQEI